MNEVQHYQDKPGLLEAILRFAENPNFNVETFKMLMGEHERLTKEKQRQEFEVAFVEFQDLVEEIKRSGKNPIFNNWYAKVEDLDAAARPAYIECGFGIRYGYKPSTKGNDWLCCTCTVSHIGGYWVDSEIDMPIDFQQGARARSDTQAVASTTTYAWRILMRGALNLVAKNNPHDNDGEGKPRPKGDYTVMSHEDSAKAADELIKAFETTDFKSSQDVVDYANGKKSTYSSLRLEHQVLVNTAFKFQRDKFEEAEQKEMEKEKTDADKREGNKPTGSGKTVEANKGKPGPG